MTVSVITENIMVQTIEATELADLLGRDDIGTVDLIDVRDLTEWESGHVIGSRSVPLETLREDPDRVLSHTSILVFVCKKGVRSLAAAKLAERFGYARIYSLDGGVIEWSNVGLPLIETRVAA